MLRRAPMGDIWRPYNYSSGDTDTAVFIQFANGRDPMAHELWCHSLAGLYRKVHLTSQLEIANGTVGEFITNYLTSDRCRNGITGEVSINGSVQLLGLPDVWGGMGYTALIPLTSTALFPLLTDVKPSTPVLLVLQGFYFNTTLYAVIIAMTSSIVGNFRAC